MSNYVQNVMKIGALHKVGCYVLMLENVRVSNQFL